MVHRTFAVVCALLLWLGPAAVGRAAEGDLAAPSSDAGKAFARPAHGPHPAPHPFTPAKAALGKVLFFDPIVSGSGTRSCASCHNPGLSWGDGLPRAIGEVRTPLALRSPTTLNLAWGAIYGWDGKFPSL